MADVGNTIRELYAVQTKLENLQLTSSFKARGACYAIMKHILADSNRGIITMSAGNHAQAVAYFANEFNVSSTIIMPEQAPFSKVSRTKELGANVILKGRTLNETSDFVMLCLSLFILLFSIYKSLFLSLFSILSLEKTSFGSFASKRLI